MNEVSERVYMKKLRDNIARQINTPENQMRSMTESTGLRIVDALYTLIDLLLMENQNGAQAEEKEVV